MLDDAFISDRFITKANNGFFEYAIGEDWNWEDFYRYMAWEGLHETTAFQTEIVDKGIKDKYDAYRAALEDYNLATLDCQ